MSDDLVFYYNPKSRASMVRWMLEEVGASYTQVLVDLEKGDHKTPEFLALNPMGKLPTIVHKGVVVTETAAIMAYLADAFPGAGLAPATSDPRRGAYYRWLFFGGSCFEPAMIDVMMKRPPVQKSMAGWGDFDDVKAALKAALATGPYLLGDQFTAADVYIGSELNWSMMFGAPGIKDEPVFTAYVDRLKARDAFKRASAG
jgi:glutathione S-transferase